MLGFVKDTDHNLSQVNACEWLLASLFESFEYNTER